MVQIRARRVLGVAGGAAAVLWLGGCSGEAGAEPQRTTVTIGERPAIERHIDHGDLVSGKISVDEMFDLGEKLFIAKYNVLDGQGRPGATGDNKPRSREPGTAPGLLRTSGPDANACVSCHNEPRAGGGGEFVTNVFALAQNRDPVTFDVREADERNSLGMMGAGPIELLGREMTGDLLAQRARAVETARSTGAPVTVSLDTKGVNFGTLTALPDGTVDTSGVRGVDTDLVIKPFHQKGIVRSLREFSVNAMNHHHGMQAVERFGRGQRDYHGNVIDTDDFDRDGVPNELTIGDITAVSMFQALLNVPGQVIPAEPERARAALRGEGHFEDIGCASCHMPELVLNDPVFCEPYARNLPGTFSDQSQKVCVDLTRDGPGPRLVRRSDGTAVVRAYTDLKRHVICDRETPRFCDDPLPHGGVPIEQFLTRKLWDAGSSEPYGHRGDLTTLTEAIRAHGGEATAARDAFNRLPPEQQAEIVEFLKSLQILPEGTPALVVDTLGRPVDKVALARRFGVQ